MLRHGLLPDGCRPACRRTSAQSGAERARVSTAIRVSNLVDGVPAEVPVRELVKDA
jgi:hypothetical protein